MPIEVNSLRPRQSRRHLTDGIFKRIFLKENVGISIKMSLKFVPKSPIGNILAMFQITAWRRPGASSEAMMVRLLTHICVARPQWVKAQMSKYMSCLNMYVIIYLYPHFNGYLVIFCQQKSYLVLPVNSKNTLHLILEHTEFSRHINRSQHWTAVDGWMETFQNFWADVLFQISINSLWPSDTMWRYRPGLTLAQIMDWCLMVPSHYLNQYWLFIKGILCHSNESNFTRSAHGINS